MQPPSSIFHPRVDHKGLALLEWHLSPPLNFTLGWLTKGVHCWNGTFFLLNFAHWVALILEQVPGKGSEARSEARAGEFRSRFRSSSGCFNFEEVGQAVLLTY